MYSSTSVIIQDLYTDISMVSPFLIGRRDVSESDSQGGLTYLDIITFYHHAGLIAAACSMFEIAKEMFSIVSASWFTTSSGS
jgi:hypothetical protein